MNLNKLTKFATLRRAVTFARGQCVPKEEYRALVVGYYAAIRELGAIKYPRPKHRAKQIARKIKSTKRHMIASGVFSGGRVPFGYAVQDGKLIINHIEDEAVSMMLLLRPAGHSYREISKRIVQKLGITVSFTCIRKICLGQRFTPIS